MNPNLFSSLGDLLDHHLTSESLIGKTSCGVFRVMRYNDSICRISISRTESFDDFSYAVVATPEGNTSVEDGGDNLLIRAANFQLKVYKNPVRFSFLDRSGAILNEDDAGMGTGWIGEQVTTYKALQPGERFIGLGEKTGPLDRKGFGYQNWNTDAYAYHSGTDPLYCSTPFYIGIHSNRIYGVFLDNSHKTFFNFGASNDRYSSFAADAGDMNYYLIAGDSVAEIIRQYTHLTGRMDMPPLWSIGYQQCRYSYYPDKEVHALARSFRERDIPADVIVLDIHYMDAYKIFTWDKKNFPNPQALIDELRSQGFHVVVLCDPGIKVEPGYSPYDEGVKDNLFINYPDGIPYAGQVWPGWCHFPDFTNPKARTWWKEKFKGYVNLGIEGFWNDMNEIATWGHSLPENLVFDFEGSPATTRKGRNIYGFQMARSTYEGTRELMKGRRPFSLTRAGFCGVQRYAAVWTGDNVSYDEHMMLGVRLVNSLGLTGVAFAGYDVGGFVGDAGTKLYARWISIGALAPFFRGHTMINSRDSEPWSYGEEVEQIARNYIKFRYQLMPYLYSLFYDASRRGMPVQRSLALEYPFDYKVFEGAFQNQYLFGPYILVAPVESTKDLTKVYLPAGDWYYVFTGQYYSGSREIVIECPIHRLPIFIKAGAVIPMQPALSNTSQRSSEIILHVYPGPESAAFTLYDDDGITFEYQKGASSIRAIRYEPTKNEITLTKSSGAFVSTYKSLQLVFHNFGPDAIDVDGRKSMLTTGRHSFFTPIEKYDPINDPESMGDEEVKYVTVNYSTEQMNIHW